MIGIHQPEHMPWMGFFDKMAKVNNFVILDNVQFRKNNYQNRNRIKLINEESSWLTVPIRKTGLSTEIRNVQLLENSDWKTKYLDKVRSNYLRSPNFELIFPQLSEIILRDHEGLMSLNVEIIIWIMNLLDITTRLSYASEIVEKYTDFDVVYQLIVSLNEKEYLSGPSGRNYLDLQLYHEKGINLIFYDFKNPNYMRAIDGENLSSLHYLFNHLNT